MPHSHEEEHTMSPVCVWAGTKQAPRHGLLECGQETHVLSGVGAWGR